MERRSSFRFRLPWSQPEPEPASKPSTQPNAKTSGSNRTTRQVTRSRTSSQPSSSTTPKTSSSSSPTTENTTPKKRPSATTTTTSGTQGRKKAPASTTNPAARSPTPLPQKSAETKATSQTTTTSTSSSAETPVSNPQPSAESKAPIQSTTNTSPLPKRSPVPSQPSAESKAPIQSSTTNTSRSPETNPVLPQSSSDSKAPIRSSTTNTKPTNAPASPKSEPLTPTTTITTTPTSTISQRPQSSPPSVSPSTTESQPLKQQGIASQPASPSDVATKSNVSQPPYPSLSRPAPQSREMSPKSSPTRKGPQVLLTDKLTPKASLPASQTSKSPPKQSQESSETSSKSTEKLPSISEKKTMATTVWPQSEQMELQKKEAIAETFAEATSRSPVKVMQPSDTTEKRSTGGITEGSKISDSSRIISEPKTARLLETNIQETKVKEVVQEAKDKNYGAGENIGSPVTSKEQPGIVFQSKKASSDDDQIQVNRVSNGKQTGSVSSQLKNKTIVSGSKETAFSAEHNIPLIKDVKNNISKFIHRMAVGDGKQNLEERPVSVITLAGDNRGASMQLGLDSSRKGRAIHIRRGYKLNEDEITDASTDAEGRQQNDARTMKDQAIEAYMNCNVQGLNNSITFDSSIEEKNPGIHMSLPRMPSEKIRSSEGTGLFEVHKAEFNVTRGQKHTYKPTIRRGCLEGLFVEPSDSDSDNPEKPRRHGCYVGNMEKTDNEIDIL